jgi:predicted RNA-binding protein YlqC (UPF0109 family)
MQGGRRWAGNKEGAVEKDLVEYIAKSLVDDPSGVVVNIIEGEKSTILELRVAQDDVGKVIGKHGRIAKAIRTILSASATKSGKRVVLEILD